MNGFQLLSETAQLTWDQIQPISEDSTRLTLAALFATSGYWKWRSPDTALAAIRNFGFHAAPPITAAILGIIEFCIAFSPSDESRGSAYRTRLLSRNDSSRCFCDA